MDERLNYAPCGYVSITHEGMVAEVNQTFLDMMGYRLEDVLQKHFEAMMSTANKLIFHSYFYPHINLDGHVEELFIRLKNSRGESVPLILNGRKFEREGQERLDCVLVQMGKRIDYEMELRMANKQIEEAYWEKDQALAELQQIHAEIERKQTELMEINAVLLELSNTDKLTGLKNRRFFQERLEEQLMQYNHNRIPLSLFIIDIDHFKRVNDTWGHGYGDEVLFDVATILKTHALEGETVARYGGEEFVMILPETDAEKAKAGAERLRRAVQDFSWKTGSMTISIGIITANPDDNEATLLQKADEALYASKQNGRNQVTHYDDLRLRGYSH
ncbi:sensor domain-containing diguanylate cyclase [Paenibacillus sp. Y412MC10]|uniref:sensor domain-containing diguanylate cyclase n=1 Tax=Geobacillus sp. (strain Y412MC10) TaxID=481743 RepID=UPI0001B9EDE1|nr:sensor domain-containing diguanylate cyclase [Paenibacillus sp. Y412MC10]ACX68413.1 diguanylate cyclase with PAS/PAC sensor [Paenibacillus sp. Y412MC10]